MTRVWAGSGQSLGYTGPDPKVPPVPYPYSGAEHSSLHNREYEIPRLSHIIKKKKKKNTKWGIYKSPEYVYICLSLLYNECRPTHNNDKPYVRTYSYSCRRVVVSCRPSHSADSVCVNFYAAMAGCRMQVRNPQLRHLFHASIPPQHIMHILYTSFRHNVPVPVGMGRRAVSRIGEYALVSHCGFIPAVSACSCSYFQVYTGCRVHTSQLTEKDLS